MLKEVLLQTEPGKQVKVITDNETSLKNLVTYLKDQGIDPEVSSEGKVHTIVAERPLSPVPDTDPADYCTVRIYSQRLCGLPYR